MSFEEHNNRKKANNKHKRHDCFRGDVRVLQRIDGKMVQISRVRKRFKTYEDAHAWARGLECKE